jgi:exonuclease III
MKYFFNVLLLLTAGIVTAQVPKVGQAGKTEIACWNVEWFGSTQFGPANETLQYNNIKTVLQNSDIDIWGLEEVSNPNTFVALMNELPQYGYVLASYSQTQKTALIWKKSLFRRVTSGLILNQYANEFASGRLPLEVRLVSDSLPKLDTLILIVLHLKANVGTDAEKLQSYYDRKTACSLLKQYMDQNMSGRKVAVIGDWNDRLTTSIYKDSITPFKSILTAPSDYFFTTLARNQNGETTVASYANSFIDHIMINKNLNQTYEAGSARVFPLNNYITDYANTTSDHYPVYSFFNFNPGVGVKEINEDEVLNVFPNPAADVLHLTTATGESIAQANLSSAIGTATSLTVQEGTVRLDRNELCAGIYVLQVEFSNGQKAVKKIVLK